MEMASLSLAFVSIRVARATGGGGGGGREGGEAYMYLTSELIGDWTAGEYLIYLM